MYTPHFEKGFNKGGLHDELYTKRDTGTRIRWKPDLEVFNEIDIPLEFFQDTLRRLETANSSVRFELKNESKGGFEVYEYYYEDGIDGHVKEFIGKDSSTSV